MIDDDVVYATFPRARARSVKNNIVKPHRIKVSMHAGLRPNSQFPLPVLVCLFRDCRFYRREKLLRQAVAQRRQHVLLRRKIKIERPLGDISARGDLLNRGRPGALFEKQTPCGVHNLIAPLCRRLRPRTEFTRSAHKTSEPPQLSARHWPKLNARSATLTVSNLAPVQAIRFPQRRKHKRPSACDHERSHSAKNRRAHRPEHSRNNPSFEFPKFAGSADK